MQNAPLSSYNLTWYHVTFLWHYWDHWYNRSSPSSHLIEPYWHTVNGCIFDKIYGPNLSRHKSGPRPLLMVCILSQSKSWSSRGRMENGDVQSVVSSRLAKAAHPSPETWSNVLLSLRMPTPSDLTSFPSSSAPSVSLLPQLPLKSKVNMNRKWE